MNFEWTCPECGEALPKEEVDSVKEAFETGSHQIEMSPCEFCYAEFTADMFEGRVVPNWEYI